MKKNWFFKKHRYLLSYAGKILRVMKLTTFLIILTSLQLLAVDNFAQTQRLSLNVSNESIQNVLEIIENETDYFFFYNSQGISLDKKVSLNLSEKSISDVLNSLFEGENISYTISNRQIILAGNEFQVLQQRKVTGKVTDASGEALPGVTVLVKGTTQGSVTDFDGNYTIADVSAGATLVFSFVGMRTQEVAVGNQETIDVTMAEDAIGIEEVVAVGYGTVRKSDLTGAVSRVGSKQLADRPVLRVDQMLQGQAAGVDVKSTTGAPGASTTIRIRGARSINATNEPLYVVDGIIGSIDLNSINPEDIESIDILKDASATAIYGSRGANGVILVTTKRGKKGEDRISVSMNTGVEKLPEDRKPDLMNAAEFVQFIKDARENKKTPAQLESDQQYQYVNNLDLDEIGEGTDWLDAVSRLGSFTNLNMGISGGDEDLQYYLSGNYGDQEGILLGSGFTRYQLRLNLDKQFGNVVKIGTSLNISSTKTDITHVDVGKSTSWSRSALALSPTFPVYNEDGSIFSFNNFYYSGGNDVDTPIGYNLRTNYEKVRDLLGNVYADFRVLEGLHFKTTLGAQYKIRRWNFYNPTNMPRKIAQKKEIGYVESRFYTTEYLLFENTLTYTKAFGKHHLNALAGATWQNDVDEYLRADANVFTNDIFKWNNLDAAEKAEQRAHSAYGENTMVSFLGRLNYNYASKYYLTVTSRYDGASNFAKDHKWGFFPSAAVKWRMSEESFIKDLGYFDNLSLRVSYGKSGNQGISNYASLGTLSNTSTGYTFGDTPNLAYYSGRLPNNDLTWETSNQLDIGLEMAFLGGRIAVETNYYDTRTKDLLLNVQIPKQTGYSSRLMNLGETFSRGFEFAVNTRNVQGSKFSWDTQLTLTSNKQEIVDLGPLVKVAVDNNSYGGSTTYYEVGVPLGALYGAYYEGTWKSQAEIDAELAKPEGERQYVSRSNMYEQGRMKYRDVNGDGKLDQEDMPYQGSPNPKVFGRLDNTFRYGNWDLNIAFNGSFGAKMYNDVMFFMGTGGSDGVYTNQYKFYTDYWHPTRNPYSEIPVPNSRDNIPSTYILQDASFLRFSTLKLGYNIDAKKLGMDFIRNAYVYFSGNNLWLWTDYNNFDPEVNKNGTSSTVRGKDDGAYPNSRAFTFGVKVDF